MAASPENSESLDRRRLEFEHNADKLRKVVRHWQTWEAEYEGFKEEIQKLKPDATPKEIQGVADEFGGEILTSKECRDLLHSSSGAPRDAAQITNILDRRIDYVQENIKTAQKQLSAAESKIDALNSVLEIQPRDEDGLPLQEITEVLDEDDNVISSNVVDTSSVAPEILDSLRKSGVKGIPGGDDGDAKARSSENVSSNEASKSQDGTAQYSASKPKTASATPAKGQKTESFPSFDATEQIPTKVQGKTSMNDEPISAPSTVHEDVLRSLNEDSAAAPIIPSNETPEEAALRREMLQYSMNEVGAVVATMDFDQIDRSDNGDIDDDFNDDEDNSYDDDDYGDSDEPEDEYGRTTVRVLDDKYRQEMQELEARLNARAIVNVGRTIPKNVPVDQNEKLPSEDSIQPPPKSSGKKKKGVRFADSLDISEPTPAPSSREPAERPIADTIVERSSPASDLAPTPSKKPVSKFSTARSGTSSDSTDKPKAQKTPSISSGPLAGMDGSFLAPLSKGQTERAQIGTAESEKVKPKPIIAQTLVERSPDANGGAAVTAPDESDPAVMHQQVATEYLRMRNRLLQRNGGVDDRDEDEDAEMQEESGKKVSRFKAAKVSQIRK